MIIQSNCKVIEDVYYYIGIKRIKTYHYHDNRLVYLCLSAGYCHSLALRFSVFLSIYLSLCLISLYFPFICLYSLPLYLIFYLSLKFYDSLCLCIFRSITFLSIYLYLTLSLFSLPFRIFFTIYFTHCIILSSSAQSISAMKRNHN